MLVDIIKNNATAKAACESGQWSDAVTALVADVIAVRDSTGWKMDDLIDTVGTVGTRRVFKALTAAGASDELLEAVREALTSPLGVRLDTDEKQAMIDDLADADGWPIQLRTAIKGLGVKNMPAVEASTGSIPDAAAVQLAWESDQVSTYDLRGALLSLNKRPDGKSSLSVRVTQYGTTAVGGMAKGSSTVLNVADTSQPVATPHGQALVDAINAAVDAYIAAEG